MVCNRVLRLTQNIVQNVPQSQVLVHSTRTSVHLVEVSSSPATRGGSEWYERHHFSHCLGDDQWQSV